MIDQARAAGVQVQEGSRVATVSGSLLGGFYLTVQSNGAWREVEAQTVIGAQGKRSRLDAALGRQFIARPQPFVALKAHFWGPAIPGRIELHAFPGGYCGLSEIEGDRRNLCLLVSQAVFQRRRQGAGDPVSNFIEWMGTQDSSLGEWLTQAERIHPWIAIAQVPFSPKPPLEQDVLMAGDAAGLIVPLAGDGIAMALESGQLASDCLLRYLAGEWTEEDVRNQYPALWRARFGKRMRWARSLQPLLMSPTVTPLIIRILLLLPALGNALIVNTRGRTPQSTGG
jgi:flavin-dependent dehydrogenase